MIFSQEIIKISLLGTSNTPIDLNLFPKDVKNLIDTTRSNEQQFLDALSLHLAYIQGGNKSVKKLSNLRENIISLPNEELPYCNEKIDKFLEQLIIYQQYAKDTFLNALIDKISIEGYILPLKYMLRFDSLTQKQLASFGKRAIWLDNLKKQPSLDIDYLSFTKTKRYDYFKQLLKNSDFEKLMEFLQEIFESENITGKLVYLKMIKQHQSQIDIRVLEPIKNFIVTSNFTSESYENLKAYYWQIILIHNPDTTKLEDLYKNYLSRIWIKSLLKKKLIEPEALLPLVEKIDFFNFRNSDEIIEFIFKIIPVDWWCKQLNLTLDKFIEYIVTMKNTYDKESILGSIASQITISKNITLFKVLLKSKQEIYRLDLSKYFEIVPEDELVNFLIEYQNYFISKNFQPIDLIHKFKILREPWDNKLSEFFLAFISNNNSYYNSYILKYLWNIAPYIDDKSIERLCMIIKENKNVDLEDELSVLIKIREQFQII